MGQSSRQRVQVMFVLLLSGLSLACTSPPTVQSVLANANKTMGSITAIHYTGKGWNGNYGQAVQAGQAWPRRDVTYTRSINYDQKSSGETWQFAEAVIGGQTQSLAVNGDKAWNETETGITPQPATVEVRQLAIWMTPHGFLKAAAAAKDAVLTLSGGQTITFTPFVAPNKYKFTGKFDAAHLLTSVETKIADPVLGDTPLIARYSEYKDFQGVQFPRRIIIDQGGSTIADLHIDNVEPDARVYIAIPEAVSNAPTPKVVAESTELADGVWLITGGIYHSLLVEFKDFCT
ncbi:MAG: hypothetical protein ABI824_14325, partial [Acidobacteriota bacterium]